MLVNFNFECYLCLFLNSEALHIFKILKWGICILCRRKKITFSGFDLLRIYCIIYWFCNILFAYEQIGLQYYLVRVSCYFILITTCNDVCGIWFNFSRRPTGIYRLRFNRRRAGLYCNVHLAVIMHYLDDVDGLRLFATTLFLVTTPPRPGASSARVQPRQLGYQRFFYYQLVIWNGYSISKISSVGGILSPYAGYLCRSPSYLLFKNGGHWHILTWHA